MRGRSDGRHWSVDGRGGGGEARPMSPGPAAVLGRAATAALEVLAPTRCVACERPGAVLCERCRSRLRLIDPATACPRCGAPFGRMVCTECRGAGTALDWCVAAATFDDPAPQIVRGYKDGGERRLAAELGGLMAASFDAARKAAPEEAARLLCAADLRVTFVPATGAAFRRRGFDHMEIVARAVSASLGLPFADVLAKRGKTDQRGRGRLLRARQLQGAFEVVGPVEGATLLLLDDVITTGATMEEAARALRAVGARAVVGLAFARVW